MDKLTLPSIEAKGFPLLLYAQVGKFAWDILEVDQLASKFFLDPFYVFTIFTENEVFQEGKS